MAMSERQALDLWRLTVCATVKADRPDLTARQQAILMTVSLTRGPHTVRGLSDALGLAKPAITRALDTLERHDLVKRVRDNKDLRNVFLERTPEGARALRALAAMIIAAESGEDPSKGDTEGDNIQVA